MEVVAHRAGNAVATAAAALGEVDIIELDVHVLGGRVEVRHAKVLRPTRRLWEKWYFLPPGSEGVPIENVLAVLQPTTPLMVDLKCFTRRSARKVLKSLPAEAPVIASTRNWWTLAPFVDRSNTRVLKSCGTRWQLWWVLRLSKFGADSGVCIHERRLTPEALQALQARTSLLFTWGATTAERCDQLREAGITGVILDDYSLV